MQLANGYTGLQVATHGGNCCGAKHIHTFPYDDVLTAAWSLEQRIGWINSAVEECIYQTNYDACGCGDTDCEDCASDKSDITKWHVLCEVILNESQTVEWQESLEACGFKKVFSFLNSNTDNQCYLFLKETGE